MMNILFRMAVTTVILIVCVVIYSVAFAAPTPRECSGLQWVAPTTDTEGNLIAGVDGYRLYDMSGPSMIVETIDTTVSAASLNLVDGNYTFAVTAWITDLASSEGYLESAYSNTLDMKVVGGILMRLGIPAAPSELSASCPF